jgi:hypothetical protein
MQEYPPNIAIGIAKAEFKRLMSRTPALPPKPQAVPRECPTLQQATGMKLHFILPIFLDRRLFCGSPLPLQLERFATFRVLIRHENESLSIRVNSN